jgi:hypothetical protein
MSESHPHAGSPKATDNSTEVQDMLNNSFSNLEDDSSDPSPDHTQNIIIDMNGE